MTLHLQDGLPAAKRLLGEGLPVATHGGASASTRTIGLVNLMPDKLTTEAQFARLLAKSGHDCELVLLRPSGRRCRHAPEGHMAAFYRTWDEIDPGSLDGLIVTGAPVETLDFEAVDYWSQLTGILDWAAATRLPAMHVCWAGQAALYHYHGVGKHTLARKQFGVFTQSVLADGHGLLSGIPGRFPVPVSRHTDVCAADLARARGLAVLAASPESGLCIVEDRARRALCVFNHFEYDADTLAREYRRDVEAGRPVLPSEGCGAENAARAIADPSWRATAERLFSNWVGKLGAAPRAPK